MEYNCKYCGKKSDMPLNWPSPRMCVECKPKFKPCPFCGIWGAVWPIHDEAAKEFFIECAMCHAHGPRKPLAELAIHYWNRRQEAIEPAVLK